jgi:hypothetical protein
MLQWYRLVSEFLSAKDFHQGLGDRSIEQTSGGIIPFSDTPAISSNRFVQRVRQDSSGSIPI